MPSASLVVRRCRSCQATFAERSGPCPRCGSRDSEAHDIPPAAVVLAAVESLSPPAGFAAPLRLALVEAADAVRLLAMVDGELPAAGTTLVLRREDGRWRAGRA